MGVLSPSDGTTEVSPPPATPFHSPLLKREMPGLDALRGAAVLAVVLYHGLHWWLPPALSISPGAALVSWLASPGWLGVNLFFVLSGFLITGILLDTRTRPNYWKSFYSRRILRIVPLYLVTLLILRFYEGFSWLYILLCLLYLANLAPAMNIYSYGPLWSLAVEEQFYLVWPFLVRSLRLRTLAMVCLGSIFLSPLLRYLSVSRVLPLGNPHTTTWLLTDNLATGALIAILLRARGATPQRVRGLTAGAGLLGATLLALGLRLHLMDSSNAIGAAFQTEPLLLLFAALLLLSLQYGDTPLVFLLTRPLRFFGYISYGLYLLHLVGFRIYEALFTDFYHPLPELTVGLLLLRFCGVLAVTTWVCYLSRRYFEEYFLRLKDRLVPYTSPREALPAKSPWKS
jgi:peptidoglycan/LPS O-acetylase OafA/YrhL